MTKQKGDEDQLGLALPGLYELARPRSTNKGPEKLGYHWGSGQPLPKLGRHSAAKHDIYSTYVDRFVSTLTRRHVQSQLKLTIVDGFCGGGVYESKGKVTDC